MPGRGCLARKAIRRAERDRLLAEESGLPAAKLQRTGNGEEPAHIEKTWVEVPPLDDLSPEDRVKAIHLCHALWEATQEFGNNKVTVSQLGSHFKVATIKKDPSFTNMRLVDILQRHGDVFELIPETGSVTGGWVVRLRPHSESMLPGRSWLGMMAEKPHAERAEEYGLPERIEEPTTMEQRLQAIRIEVMYALHKRGLRVMLHDLGQEPKILKHKNAFLAGRKLLELIKIFPMNFMVEDKGNGNFLIELISLDVADCSMVFEFVQKAAEAPPPPENKGKGKNKGKSKMMAMMAMMMGKGPGTGSNGQTKGIGMKGVMAKGMLAALAGKAQGKGKGCLAKFAEPLDENSCEWGLANGLDWSMLLGAELEWQEPVICSVHGKSRNPDCLQDDGAGGFRCSPGFECKLGAGSGSGGGNSSSGSIGGPISPITPISPISPIIPINPLFAGGGLTLEQAQAFANAGWETSTGGWESSAGWE